MLAQVTDLATEPVRRASSATRRFFELTPQRTMSETEPNGS